ncbi:MAG: cysteine--tRNA ligase [Demequinaceae bacterium]|nr:cysteine--tRNA ligase [Demequinaceae bacterium]
MTLRLFDSAAREIRDFVPLRPNEVGVYVCGPTVQGAPHIGHMRTGIAFDVLHRWLERSGMRVTMIRNVTDVDDKIFAKSAEVGEKWWSWATRFEREFASAHAALGCLPAACEPRATGHIPDILDLIGTLVERGHAYEHAGSVYFDVQSYADYGALTNQRLGDLEPSEDESTGKGDPRDFALWKAAKESDPPGGSWDSPWGPGRPGWHIECSAMARRYLGDEFDIHGGGLDLRFPHHENEQAQSRAAGYGFARLWMHSAWLTLSGTKMSKSLGNSMLVREVLKEGSAAALRLALVSVHYRSMLEYTDTTLTDAEATFSRLEGFVRRAGERVGQPSVEEVRAAALPEAFAEAMDDDLAVPRALVVVHDAVREGNTALSTNDDVTVTTSLLAVRAMLDALGLDPLSEQWTDVSGSDRGLAALGALVVEELAARDQAREAKDWTEADAIRDRLAAAGILIEDSADGARWSLSGEG